MIRSKNGKMEFIRKRVWNIFFISLFLIMYLVLSRHYSLALNETVNESQNQTNQTEPVNLTNQTNVPPYVEPVIYKELVKSEWVQVIIDIYNESTIDLTISNLPPSEFQFERKSYFNNSFSGNITRRGLDLLLNNSAVSAVYLGGTAQVALDKNETIGNETNQSESNVTINQTNLTKPYIDPEIFKAFENQTWVKVSVFLRDNSNITVTGTKEQRRNLSRQRDEFLTSEAHKFVINLSEGEIKEVREHTGGFTADINKQGFEKLVSNSRVNEIILAYTEHGYGATNISTYENQSLIKNEEIIEDKNKADKMKFVLLWGAFFTVTIFLIVYLLIKRRK